MFGLLSCEHPVQVSREQSCRDCHSALSKGHERHFSLPVRFGEYGSELPANNTSGYTYNCGVCHPLDHSRHRDGKVDMELAGASSKGIKALSKGASFDAGARTCLNVYCHNFKPTPAWGTTFDAAGRCRSCHDTPPRSDAHFNVAQGTGHLLGIHWDSADGHGKDAGKEYMMGCNTCHYAVIAKEDTTFTHLTKGKPGVFSCNRCHTPVPGEIRDHSLHVNGKPDIAFSPVKLRSRAQLLFEIKGWKRVIGKGSRGAYDETSALLNTASYNRENKTCLDVACHLGVPVRWDEKVTCASCHKGY